MKTKIVNVLMSKKLRIVVTSRFCEISPASLGSGNKKTACMHLCKKVNLKTQLRHLVKEQQCEFYEKDSLQKHENGLNTISCNFN